MQYRVSKKYPHLEVSATGHVRRIRDGFVFTVTKPTKAGYLRITGKESGKRFNVFVHSLVAEGWVLGHAEGLVVNHKDGNKLNNNDWNLEWVTQAYNIQHAQLNGLTTSKHSPESLLVVCSLLEKGMSVKDVSLQTGVDDHTVQDIKGGKWKVFGDKFNIPSPRKRVSDETIHWVCQKMVEGLKNSVIERTCPYDKISRATVSGIRNKLYFEDIVSQYF